MLNFHQISDYIQTSPYRPHEIEHRPDGMSSRYDEF